MAENNFSLADYGINQLGVVDIKDAMATYVKDRFDEAVRHKRNTGIEEKLLRNLRAANCEYQPDEKALLGPYNDVYMGICALKARAAESWLNDIILNNIDKPWTLDPTPQPELPTELKEEAVNIIMAELPKLNSIEALRSRLRELKGAMNTVAFAQAEEATKRMETLISDQFIEGKWQETFAAFIYDICSYPTAIIRGPILVSKQQGTWDGSKYKIKAVPTPTSRTVSPFDAYPSPTSKSTQDGEFFCERARFSQGDIHNLLNVEGFSEPNIRQVLETYSEGFKLNLMFDTERDYLEKKEQGLNQNDGKLLDTIIYNGVVPGHLLAENGVIVKDYQKYYECEVWVVGDITIRAILNPNPLGKRPLYSTSYRKINGCFWGLSVICLTYDTGRVCNAAARALVRNMGYSSGPLGEVVSERVADTDDPTDIRPYKVALVGPDLSGTGAPAYRFHNVQSVSADLMAVFDSHMKIADDLSGVPSYVLGNPEVAGAGRTMGGLAMLMGNAAKGIKNVHLNIDRDVISPLVEAYFVFNMQTSDDNSIKADAKVVARGATGLLQRELAQTRTVELLQLLTPYIETWDTLPVGIKVLLREVLKSTGLPIDDIIPDPASDAKNLALAKLASGSLGGMPQGAGSPGGPPMPGPPGPPPGPGPTGPTPGVEETMNRGTSTPVPLPTQSMPSNVTPFTGRPPGQ